MNQEQAPPYSDSGNEAPFEWLTNFQSLRHLVLPSRIVFGHDMYHDEPSSYHLSLEEEVGRGEQNNHLSKQPGQIYLNALHVGCGTSTLGESLACLRELYSRMDTSTNKSNNKYLFQYGHIINESNNKYPLQYGHIINVDNDQNALDSMRCRWKCKLRHHQTNIDIDDGNSRNNDDMANNISIEWKHLDFASDESCRMALDDLYRQLMMQQTVDTTIERSSLYINEEEQAPGGCIDLVIDKSTLDCLLCSETTVIAQFLCEIYRALRVPSMDEFAAEHDVLTWGGVYVLITFHPVEFIDNLLKRLPGADWDVDYQVIQRQVEDVTCLDRNLELDEVVVHNENECKNNRTTEVGEHGDGVQHSPPHTYAWSSGSFHPDKNYRKTVNAFTCRRRNRPRCRSSTVPTFNDDNNTSSTSLPTYILDREEVRKHIEQTCDEWYRLTNPIVTKAREEQLRAAFLRSAEEARIDGVSSETEALLNLEQCYDIIFTDAEKEHLDYEHFREDWDAYCSSRAEADGSSINTCGMTVAIALDFLNEMQ